jgi:hypothetical protein
VLADGAVVNTDSGNITSNSGQPIAVPTSLVAAPSGGVAVRVIMVKTLTITGRVEVKGAAGLAVVADGPIDVSSTLDLGVSGAFADATCVGKAYAISHWRR